MGDNIISYNLIKISDGYIARCLTNDNVTGFGKTEHDAQNNLVTNVKEYLELFPNKEKEIFKTSIKTVKV